MLVTRGGRLPNVPALARAIHSVGDPFTLRGVEATVDGCLERRGNQWALRVTGTRDLLLLIPLQHKVQWDPRERREQPATATERGAYVRLAGQALLEGRAVRVVGPLRVGSAGEVPRLEVREFLWQR